MRVYIHVSYFDARAATVSFQLDYELSYLQATIRTSWSFHLGINPWTFSVRTFMPEVVHEEVENLASRQALTKRELAINTQHLPHFSLLFSIHFFRLHLPSYIPLYPTGRGHSSTPSLIPCPRKHYNTSISSLNGLDTQASIRDVL